MSLRPRFQRRRIHVPNLITITTITVLWATVFHWIFPDFYGQSSVWIRVTHGFIIGGMSIAFVQYMWKTRFDPNRPNKGERMKLRLTGSPEERTTLLMFSLITLLFCGFMFYTFLVNVPAEEGWGVWRIVMIETYFTFALFGFYGLIWSFTTPRWLERILRSTVRTVLLFVFTLVGRASSPRSTCTLPNERLNQTPEYGHRHIREMPHSVAEFAKNSDPSGVLAEDYASSATWRPCPSNAPKILTTVAEPLAESKDLSDI